MVERFHHQLKGSLKAHQNSSWVEFLPLVLLGIRSALKEDLRCTTIEMVYGTSLRLPGPFFTSQSTISLPDPSSYVTQLKCSMEKILPPPPRPNTRGSRVSDDLASCTHVFVRYDSVRKPLQPP